MARFGWRVESDLPREIVIAVPMVVASWPATVTARFMGSDQGPTSVALDGRPGGARQELELRGQLIRLRAALEQAAGIEPTVTAGSGSGSGSGPGSGPGSGSGPGAGGRRSARDPLSPEVAAQLASAMVPAQRNSLMTPPIVGLLLVLGVAAIVAVSMIISTSATDHALSKLQQTGTGSIFQQVQQALSTPQTTSVPGVTAITPPVITTPKTP